MGTMNIILLFVFYFNVCSHFGDFINFDVISFAKIKFLFQFDKKSRKKHINDMNTVHDCRKFFIPNGIG